MGKKIIIACMLIALISHGLFSQNITIEEAIKSTASEAANKLTLLYFQPDFSIDRPLVIQTSKIAVLNFSSKWQLLSTFVIDEMINALAGQINLTVVTRQELDLIRKEQSFQMNGDVSDESARSIGNLLGAQSIMSGEYVEIGNNKYFRIRIINVETGALEYSNSLILKSNELLTALKEVTPPSPPSRPRSEPKLRQERTEYNFFEKFGIGLLNIPFGIGSYYFETDTKSFMGWSWGSTILFFELSLAGLGAFFGTMPGAVLNDYNDENVGRDIAIGAAIGFGIGATIGFIRGFFVSKWDYTRAEAFPFEIDIVPVSSNNNVRVQMIYKLTF